MTDSYREIGIKRGEISQLSLTNFSHCLCFGNPKFYLSLTPNMIFFFIALKSHRYSLTPSRLATSVKDSFSTFYHFHALALGPTGLLVHGCACSRAAELMKLPLAPKLKSSLCGNNIFVTGLKKAIF